MTIRIAACSGGQCAAMEGLEMFMTIPVGAFADPAFSGPQVSVYEERMHAWVAPPAGAEHIH